MKTVIKTLTVAAVVAGSAALVGAYSGLVNVGADDPHFPAVHAFLAMARDRSIEVRARDLEVPNLDDPELIQAGAGNYNSMCIGCHLAPGVAATELSQALYPAPPNLAKMGVDGNPSAAFWIIKHGIKATGMPAWGKSMADPYIWGMVAFLKQLPALDAKQYQTLVAASSGHQHGGGETQMHNHEGQHGSPEPDHHAAAVADEQPGHHGAGETAAHDESSASPVAQDASTHHAEPPAPAAAKGHTHADGKEHLHER